MEDERKTKEQLIEELKAARAESALFRESEEKFRTLVEHSLVGIYILQDGRVKYANPRAAEIFGYTLEEILSMASVLELIQEEDHPVVEENIRKRMSGEVQDIHYSVRGKRKDGVPIDFEVHGALTHYEGRPAIIGTLVDTTGRNKLEESLRVALRKAADEQARSEAIIAAIGDGISIQDRNFKVLYQNRIHGEQVGWHVGEYCYQAYQGRERVCDGCHLAMSFEDGDIHKKEQYRRTEKGTFCYEIVSSPLRDSKGQTVAGIEAVRDITEQKRISGEREELIKELQEALAKIKTLSGMLPICASCKKIRDDRGYWKQIEAYISDHTDAEFSHGICPECRKRIYPDY